MGKNLIFNRRNVGDYLIYYDQYIKPINNKKGKENCVSIQIYLIICELGKKLVRRSKQSSP